MLANFHASTPHHVPGSLQNPCLSAVESFSLLKLGNAGAHQYLRHCHCCYPISECNPTFKTIPNGPAHPGSTRTATGSASRKRRFPSAWVVLVPRRPCAPGNRYIFLWPKPVVVSGAAYMYPYNRNPIW